MKSQILVIGPTGSGKTSFVHLLEKNQAVVHKTIVPEYHAQCLDTPGEYLAHRAYYGNLQVISTKCKIVVLLIACNAENSQIAPRLLDLFQGKKKIGVVSKVDLGSPKMIQRCTDTLIRSGVDDVYCLSIYDSSTWKTLFQSLGI